MNAEIGFYRPGTGELTGTGIYECVLPCEPGDICRVHDPYDGFRVGRILRIFPEEENGSRADAGQDAREQFSAQAGAERITGGGAGEKRKGCNDVFEVIRLNGKKQGEHLSVYTEAGKRAGDRSAGKHRLRSGISGSGGSSGIAAEVCGETGRNLRAGKGIGTGESREVSRENGNGGADRSIVTGTGGMTVRDRAGCSSAGDGTGGTAGRGSGKKTEEKGSTDESIEDPYRLF